MAKTKALISFAVTAKLICVFVFAYAKSRFSHDAAHVVSVRKGFLSLLVLNVAALFYCDTPWVFHIIILHLDIKR